MKSTRKGDRSPLAIDALSERNGRSRGSCAQCAGTAVATDGRHRTLLRRVVSRYAQSSAVSDNVSAPPTGWDDHAARGLQIALSPEGPLHAGQLAQPHRKPGRSPHGRSLQGLLHERVRRGGVRRPRRRARPWWTGRPPRPARPAQAHPTTSPIQLAPGGNQSAGTCSEFPSVDEIEHFGVAAHGEDGQQQRDGRRDERVSRRAAPAGGARCRGPRPGRGGGTRRRRRAPRAVPPRGRRAAAAAPAARRPAAAAAECARHGPSTTAVRAEVTSTAAAVTNAGADPAGPPQLVAQRPQRTRRGADGDGRRQRGQCGEGASHAGFDGVRRRSWGGGGRLLLGRGGGIAHMAGRGPV